MGSDFDEIWSLFTNRVIRPLKAAGFDPEGLLADYTGRSVRLAECAPSSTSDEALLGHVDQSGPEAREIPLPDQVTQELPWLAGLTILVMGPGDSSNEIRYGAELRVKGDPETAHGALRVSLVDQDGRRKDTRLTAKNRRAEIPHDFPSDWDKLTVELWPEDTYDRHPNELT